MSEGLTLTLLHLGYLTAVIMLTFRLLPPVSRRLFIGLSAAFFVWTLLAVLAKSETNFWSWFFDPGAELTISAIFSSALLLLIGVTAFIIGWRAASLPWQRVYWWPVAAIFLFLGVDEFYSLHETVLLWRQFYAITGAALVLAGFIMFRFEAKDARHFILLITAGVVITGFAGVGLDAFANDHLVSIGPVEFSWFDCPGEFLGVTCQSYGLTEELLEMSGLALIFVSMLAFAGVRMAEVQRRQMRRISTLAGAAWTIWLVSNVWLFPALESLVGTESAQADYLDGKLSLQRYRIAQDVVYPGDTLDVTLYMQANDFIDNDYSLSLHLYSFPDVDSVAQYDMMLGEWKYPTRAWIPALPVRNHFPVELPEDLPVPASYWLVVQVWRRSPHNLKPVGVTDREVLSDSTLILDSIAALPEAEVPAPPLLAGYRFAGDFTLSGYEIPAEGAPGDELTFRFWWHTEREVETELTHFLHLFHEDSGDYIIFDQIPFGGSFPTEDWPGGMRVVDEWTVQLPDDMLPGRYRVQTGLFDVESRERMAVDDPEGTAVQDFSIVLGTLVVGE